LLQTRARYKTGKACANYQHVNFIVHWLTWSNLHVRVIEQRRKSTFWLQVLLISIGANALVTLVAIPLADRFSIFFRQ
jgi:maltodextrin utilization protein YvdJ